MLVALSRARGRCWTIWKRSSARFTGCEGAGPGGGGHPGAFVLKDVCRVAGANFPGSPFPFLGHNEHLGWTNTVNTPDMIDVYQLELDESGTRYKLDGEWRDLESKWVTLPVKIGPVVLPIRKEVLRSAHGPVIKNAKGAFAIRYGGIGQLGQLDAYYRINKAKSFAEWEAQLSRLAIPSTNFIYADQTGTIAYIYNAAIPARPESVQADWRGILNDMQEVGRVMCLTRNEHCVHERHGRFDDVQVSGPHGVVLGPDIDLRLFLSNWRYGFAVREPLKDGERLSLQFFDASGEAVHKIYATDETDRAAFDALIARHRAAAPAALKIVPRAPDAPDRPDAEIDVEGLRTAWRAMKQDPMTRQGDHEVLRAGRGTIRVRRQFGQGLGGQFRFGRCVDGTVE